MPSDPHKILASVTRRKLVVKPSLLVNRWIPEYEDSRAEAVAALYWTSSQGSPVAPFDIFRFAFSVALQQYNVDDCLPQYLVCL